jgi:hypothetical protein
LGIPTDSAKSHPALASNLHGVDLNPEPVEITKLSLWLKTAKRGKMLQDLDASIKCGNTRMLGNVDLFASFAFRRSSFEMRARQDEGISSPGGNLGRAGGWL